MNETLSVKASELSVDIGMPCGPNIPAQTSFAMAKTVKACTQQRIDCGLACIIGCSVVTWARNKVLDTFLQGKANRLFWIDSDIEWEPEDFLRLLVLSTKYDVVCGVYAQKTEEQTIVLRHPDLLTFDINPYGLVKVDGAGLGFTVITREVAERLAESKPRIFDPVDNRVIADVFRCDSIDRGHEHPDFRGEDIAFFSDLADLGYDIWLDPSLQLGHIGARTYRNDPRKALRLDGVFNELQAAGA